MSYPSYQVTGCEEENLNDSFDYEKTTCGEVIWWISRRNQKMLRYTPQYGWCLGWYTHSDNGNNIPPNNGWTFNGGRCSPSTLGINIRIQPL